MSLENLIVLALFVIGSLAELIRAWKNREPRQPELPRRPAPARTPAPPSPRPPLPERPTILHTPMPLPVTPPPPVRGEPPVVAARAPLSRPRSSVSRFHGPADLRRAVVAMTILGPCRAASPYDWPDRP